MADFGQFADTRTADDYRQGEQEAQAFYGDLPRVVTSPCGQRAYLDMDSCGYWCCSCLVLIGSAACPCSDNDEP